MIKYHVMEERRIGHDALLQWAAATPFLQAAWRRFGQLAATRRRRGARASLTIWWRQGVLAREGDQVIDR